MRYKNVNEWAMCNGLSQCTGCNGYGKSEHKLWLHSKKYGTKMAYCTVECRDEEVIQ